MTRPFLQRYELEPPGIATFFSEVITAADIEGGVGTGTVTSVDGSGGTTGLTLTGGPITDTGTLTLGGTLVVGSGGTGLPTLTAHAVLLGNGTGNVTFAAPAGTGRVLIDQGVSADPAFTVISGSGATITLSAAGVVTISAIDNASLTNSSVTISGHSLSLGGSLNLVAADIGSGAALTKTDDTNVTLTLGGSPTAALLAATSITVGWTGTLALSRLAQGTDGQLIVGQTGASPLYKMVSGSGATIALSAAGVVTISAIANASLANSSITIGGTSTALGGSVLGNVTNDTQTKAAIVPNTAPAAGQVLAGNAGGTAYAPVTVSGSGATISLSAAGVVTISSIANASLANSSITATAGTGLTGGGATALGGSFTLTVAYGTSSTTACVGNDSRLSDSRAPTGSAGGDLTGIYPNPTIDVGKVTDTKGSLAWKPAVRAVSTTGKTLSGTTTVDGLAISAGQLVLLIGQLTDSQNGPWVVSAGAWTRPAWWPSGGTTQAFIWALFEVLEGTAYAGSLWYVATSGTLTIDTTPVSFTQIQVVVAGANVTGTVALATSAGTCTGNSATATALATGRTISITGDLTYTSGSFDGTANVTGTGTLASVASAGTTGSSTAIPVITINAKGLTTSITTAAVVAPAGTLTGTTLASNVVTSSLTAVGTLVTGVWHATLVGVLYGGTGADLSATGGTSQYVKQASAGAALTVGVIPVADLPAFTGLTVDDVGLTDRIVEYNAGVAANGTVSVQRLGGFINPQTNDFRLTLVSGTAVPASDQTAKTTIYLTPKSNAGGTTAGSARIAVYDGTRHNEYLSVEISLALGTLVNAQAYDVFLYDNAGTLTLESLEWQNATVTMTLATPCVVTYTSHGLVTGNSFTLTTSGALYTGLTANTQYFVTKIDANTFKLSTSLTNVAAGTFIATSGTQSGTHTGHSPTNRATALNLQDGVLQKAGALTRRYLGSFLATSTTTTEDSEANRLVWNYYNRQNRSLRVTDAGNWNYTLAAYRQANGNTANRVAVLVGWPEEMMYLDCYHSYSNTLGGGVPILCGIGEDNATTNAATLQPRFDPGSANILYPAFAKLIKTPVLGYHQYVWQENSFANGVTTWYSGGIVTGLNGWYKG